MKQTLIHVQYLRFIAAAMVVMHHTWQIVPKHGRGDLGPDFALGASGVDIFFVISGFIMCIITEDRERGALDFAAHRLARVAPMYWLTTALMAVSLVVAPHLFASSRFEMPAFLASLAFIPWPHPTLAGAMPMLQVGWTLNYEFMFYAIFALALWVKPKRRVLITSAVLLILAATGAALDPKDVRLQFYTSPILTEFVFGMVIGHLYLVRRLPKSLLSGIILVLGACALIASALHPIEKLSPLRPLIWGLPSALIVLAAVSLEYSHKPLKAPLIRRLGDASYSIYLTHLFTLGGVGLMWQKLHMQQHVSDILLIAIGIVACSGLGWLAHWFVERPLTRFVQGSLRTQKAL